MSEGQDQLDLPGANGGKGDDQLVILYGGVFLSIYPLNRKARK